MHQRKAVIADPNEEFRAALAQALSSDFQVICLSDGAEALEAVREHTPEILILDLILENMDGLTLLNEIRQLPRQPKVLVISGFLSGFVHSALEQIGVTYAMFKSCPVQAAADMARQITAEPAQQLPFPPEYMLLAGELLMELGLANGRQGYQHMLTGLPLLMLQRDRRLSKELYLEISLLCNSSPIRVEKAIRDTIRAGWNSRNHAVWSKYFPGAARCPKNKEFLFRLTDILMEQMLKKVI